MADLEPHRFRSGPVWGPCPPALSGPQGPVFHGALSLSYLFSPFPLFPQPRGPGAPFCFL